MSICDLVPNLVTTDDNLMLTMVPDDLEIKAVVFSLDSSSG